MWKDFDDSLPVNAVSGGEKSLDGVKYEYVNFPEERPKTAGCASLAFLRAMRNFLLPTACLSFPTATKPLTNDF